MTRVGWMAALTVAGCPRAPVVAPEVAATPAPAAFDLAAAERALAAAEATPESAGWLLVTGMTEAGATPTGCARNWLDSREMEPDPRRIVLSTAFTDGMCRMPCQGPTVAVAGSATAMRASCLPDRFGTEPTEGLGAAEYAYAVLVVDGVHAALDADRSERSASLRARFDALLPSVPTTLAPD